MDRALCALRPAAGDPPLIDPSWPIRGPCHDGAVFPALLVLRRFIGAIRYAAKEEGFRAVFTAAVSLIALGTIVYSLAEGWNVGDAFYFAICTLTTSNVSDPHLVLTSEAIRIFTAFYVIVGIGILVETLRRIGMGYVRMRSEHSKIAKRITHRDDPQGDNG